MTLWEMLTATGRAIKKHDYEFLIGDDGLAHLVIFIDIIPTQGGPQFSLFCPCGAIKGPSVEKREIATGLTCLECSKR